MIGVKGQPTVARVATSRFHQWLIPEKTVIGLLILGVILIFVGAIFIGVASVTSGIFAILGGVILSASLILVCICLCLCAHACCVWRVRDTDTQTIETTVISADQPVGDWFPGYGPPDKRVPNGVLREGRQQGSLKKHVTISPRSTDSFSSGFMSGRQGDSSLRSVDYYGAGRQGKSLKSGPSSVSSDMSTLASFAYLNDPNLATPYSTLGQKKQNQANVVNIPVHVQPGYGSVPRHGEGGRMAQVRPYQTENTSQGRSNVLPGRRHSDDDYDNAADVAPMLPQQTYVPQPPPPHWQHEVTPWQQQQHQLQYQQQQQQQQQRNSGTFSQQWHHSPQQQTVWQYQTTSSGNQPQTWRQQHQSDDVPPAQPLVRPSQRRPMTFEQISSSKVSLYDNIHMNRPESDEE